VAHFSQADSISYILLKW